jgi:hypothetical protein
MIIVINKIVLCNKQIVLYASIKMHEIAEMSTTWSHLSLTGIC